MDFGLAGKSALVSGATRGIGLAVAHTLAAEGVRLSLCSRDQVALDGLGREIAARHGVDVHTFAGDLTAEPTARLWVTSALARFGRIDILVNNASATRPAMVHEASPEIWAQALDLKVFGYARMAACVFPHMTAGGGGAIVNIIGTAAVQPTRTGGVRTVAATALAGMNKALANEGAAHNIRVNAICPGHTRTHRWDEWIEEVRAAGGDPDVAEKNILADIPLGRIARPEDVAHAVAFLASEPLAGYITGVMLNVDGGAVRGL